MKHNPDVYLMRREVAGETIGGELYVGITKVCFTLEPMKNKLPEGGYTLKITSSPKFGEAPLIVSDELGITAKRGFRIHVGNTVRDTRGCPLVGDSKTKTNDGYLKLLNSRIAFERLMWILKNNQLNRDTFNLSIVEA